MKKLLASAFIGLILAGCSQDQKQGIGVIPLEGVKLAGTVVEAKPESGVLIKTKGGRSALLPDSWEYRTNEKKIDYSELAPGQDITAYAPGGEGRLVAAPGKNLVLNDGQDTFALPSEAFPPAARQAPVRVQTFGGPTRVAPLQQALYAPDSVILSHPSYADYSFPVADPYAYSDAYIVGQNNNQPLALVPGNGGLQMVTLPASYYPTQDLRTNQPVRFTYYDQNVAVTSWDSPFDGQLNLSHLMLAGTLLELLPGQAVVEVGSRPFTVPRSYLFQDNRSPVVWNNLRPGHRVNVRYYPGVYDVVDYSDQFLTLNYNNSLVQLPVAHLPQSFYRQPVAVRYNDGRHRRLPYRQARKMVERREARLIGFHSAQPKHRGHWSKGPKKGRPIKGRGDYFVYNDNGRHYVAHRNLNKRHQNVVFGGDRRNSWQKSAKVERRQGPTKARRQQVANQWPVAKKGRAENRAVQRRGGQHFGAESRFNRAPQRAGGKRVERPARPKRSERQVYQTGRQQPAVKRPSRISRVDPRARPQQQRAQSVKHRQAGPVRTSKVQRARGPAKGDFGNGRRASVRSSPRPSGKAQVRGGGAKRSGGGARPSPGGEKRGRGR